MALATLELDAFTDEGVKSILELHPWMQNKKFILLTERMKIEEYIEMLIDKGMCSLDLETTSLNTRLDKEGNPIAKIVGVCLSPDHREGAYIPVLHDNYDKNVPTDFVVRMLRLLTANCVCVFHNFKYDGEILRNHGIILEDEEKIEDTLLIAHVDDASRKAKGLKYLSEHLVKRLMLEINDLGVRGSKKKVVYFAGVSPKKAVYYGGSDSMNTFAIYKYMKKSIMEQPQGQTLWNSVYNKIEKRALFPVMDMERNLVKIDVEYYKGLREKITKLDEEVKLKIFEMAGREFDLDSPKQLGEMLFDELKLKYPDKEKNPNGTYKTDEGVLSVVKSQNPIAGLILYHRSYMKTRGTYIDNFLKNVDHNGEVKFQLNQVRADTGRFSASGGKGLLVDGCSGVNCQNIPTHDPKDPTSFNIRKGIIARPGYQIVAIDYSGEELRIAANFSREPKWIEEFVNGSADIHSITARAIYNKNEVSKQERSCGKTINFLTVYGGGPSRFAAQAKIPMEQAKKMQLNFFKNFSGLKKWIDLEHKKARKRGYSVTAFGRRRSLKEFYDSGDSYVQSKGDRCAVNSAVQGCLQPHVRCLTNKGYIPIKELHEKYQCDSGLKVWTGTSWETFDVLNRGKCQTATIELDNGMTLDCDTRHEVLAVTDKGYEFVKFSELNEDSEVCMSCPTSIEFGDYPDKEFFSGGTAHNSKHMIINTPEDWDFIAYAMGVTIGDGNIRIKSRNSVTVSFGKKELKTHYLALKGSFKKLGLNFSDPRRMKGSIGESYQAEVSSKALTSVFEYLGYSGGTARTKRVPEFIYRAPLSMRKQFLKGYFDADGCKKKENRYCFHTPNEQLLKDMQLVGWTLGFSSRVWENSDRTFMLSWGDTSKLERFFGLKENPRKRSSDKLVFLPKFLYKTVYESLKKDGRYTKSSNDKVLVCKLNKGKPILLSTALRLLRDYNLSIPQVYFSGKIVKKTINEEVEDTYTLAVHSPLHRFDSCGIISKNTGADIIKIALYRVWKWIQDNGRQDDIKILMPVHDEIVYEMKTEMLDELIPVISDIMKLRDLTQKLNWPVGLEVDAEYGDDWTVKHDYFKELKEGNKEIKKEEPKQEEPAEKKEEPYLSSVQKAVVEENVSHDGLPSTANDGAPMNFVVTVRDAITKDPRANRNRRLLSNASEEEEDTEVFQDANLKDRIDEEGYFHYPVSRVDYVTSQQFLSLMNVLINFGGKTFLGPKCKVKLKRSDGEVIYKSTRKVSVDAFVALCIWLNL